MFIDEYVDMRFVAISVMDWLCPGLVLVSSELGVVYVIWFFWMALVKTDYHVEGRISNFGFTWVR